MTGVQTCALPISDPYRQLAWLKEKVVFSIWEKKDDAHTVVRFATSWATREEEIRELMGLLDAYR